MIDHILSYDLYGVKAQQRPTLTNTYIDFWFSNIIIAYYTIVITYC